MADSVSRSLIINEAKRRGWHVDSIGHDEYFCRVTDSTGHSELVRSSRPLRSSANGFVISKYKDLTMEYVKSCGYKVPAYVVCSTPRSASSFLATHKKIVVKPVDAHQSAGVTTNVVDKAQMAEAVKTALAHSGSGKVILQEQLEGKLYRLFVLNDKLVAASYRKAPEVVGDGHRTVRELIEELNADPRRGDGADTPLKHVKLADAANYVGDKFEKVLSVGQKLRVAAIDSVSVGGEASNVTTHVHDDWKRVTVQLAQNIGLFVCGYDVICEDIAQPLADNYIPLLEMNSAPGLKLHMYPTGGGESINIAPMLLDELFP